MEFSDVGKHCYYCKQQDFLPFQCERCQRYFCLTHKEPDAHECECLVVNKTKTKTKTKTKINTTRVTKYKCSVPGCKQRMSFSNICTGCGKHHCLRHRYPDLHQCKSNQTVNTISLRRNQKCISKKSKQKSTKPTSRTFKRPFQKMWHRFTGKSINKPGDNKS